MKNKRVIIAVCMLLLAFLLAGCGGSDESRKSSEETTAAQPDSGKVILTVSGYHGKDTTFTQSQLLKLGESTCEYSGRNKEKNNQRQIRAYTGIELNKVLKAAGYGQGKEIIKVTCSDGYTREYEVDSLYDLYTFDSDKAEKGKKIAPMLAMIKDGEPMGNGKTYKPGDGSPLRLVYGQTDYDSQYTKDFNMQGWASFVEKIEVKKANE